MFTYTLYGAIAAALMRVFLAASMGLDRGDHEWAAAG